MGDSFVIFSPFLETHRVQPPIHYLMSVANSSNQEARSLLGNSGLEHTSVLNRDGDGRMGDKLYATHCSTRYFNCATDYIYIPDALQIGHNEITGCVALCGIVGGCFGFIFSLIYKRNRSIEQQLRRAIQHDEIKIVYQPIVNLVGGLVVGAEALARWTDEEGFVISPDVFIKIAEERGFVSDITKLVVRHAVRDLGETLRTHPDFRLNINVAAADLVDPTFLPMLKATLKSANVPAESVAIEITEGSTAKHETAAETIRQLREMGHSVHIDDFGTGYSSLSYLHALSIDAIKIDRAFTQAIGTEAVTVSILPQILAMAKTLNLQVIVEGVETIQQASYFANSNATILAQGWLFGRPVAAEEFCKLLLEGEQKLLSADHAA
jgi:sensor c-di-GMP phosphodiesterase-like protein